MDLIDITKKIEKFIDDTNMSQKTFMMKIGNEIARIGAENYTPEKNLEMCMKLLDFLKTSIRNLDTITVEEMFLIMDSDVRELMGEAILAVIVDTSKNHPKCPMCGSIYDETTCGVLPSILLKDIDPTFLSLYGILTKEALLSMLWEEKEKNKQPYILSAWAFNGWRSICFVDVK